MRILVALGGNALLRRGERPDASLQQINVLTAAKAIAEIAREHEVVVTHGNGPQVGMLALESATDPALTHPYPLDILGAQTQGMIGYLIAQALQNELPGRHVATIVTQTLVSATDPAFAEPTKFVGPIYTEQQATTLAAEHGWTVRQDGSNWRRVVPSPLPQQVVETPVIRALLKSGTLVVCAGGGGVPAVRDESTAQLRGVEAVVDKDRTAALLAEALDVDALMLLTDVPAVMAGYGTPQVSPIRHTTPAQLRSHQFAPGSMGPKVDAACRFVERTGHTAAIGALDSPAAMLRGDEGTIITAKDDVGSALFPTGQAVLKHVAQSAGAAQAQPGCGR